MADRPLTLIELADLSSEEAHDALSEAIQAFLTEHGRELSEVLRDKFCREEDAAVLVYDALALVDPDTADDIEIMAVGEDA